MRRGPHRGTSRNCCRLQSLQDEIEISRMFHVEEEEMEFGLLGVNLGIAQVEKSERTIRHRWGLPSARSPPATPPVAI